MGFTVHSDIPGVPDEESGARWQTIQGEANSIVAKADSIKSLGSPAVFPYTGESGKVRGYPPRICRQIKIRRKTQL